MTAALPCVCTHLKPRHAGETYACRDCGCKRYEMDLQAAPATDADLDLDALLERVRKQGAAENAEFQRVHGHCLGREAKLIGKVVEARDDAASLRRSLAAANSDRGAAGTELAHTRAELAETFRKAGHAAVRFNAVRAELASARAELERLRYSGWIVARDGGRTCGSCGQEIRRGEAYTVATTSDTTTHVHCREGDTDGN